MDKGDPPQESAPPYPGPPLNYGPPQPQVFTQQGGYPQSAPPYPGPPLNYGPPQPQAFPQQGGYPQASPYPPPPGGYQPVAPYPTPQAALLTTTVTHVIETESLHEAPGQVLCPHCLQTVVTKTKYVSGLLTWLSCVGLVFIGCYLCFCFPFCIDPCKDVEHHCPNCNRLIYVYKRMNCRR